MATPTLAAGKALVNVFDGTRQPYSGGEDILFTVRDGNQNVQRRKSLAESSVLFSELPLFDNHGDEYTFLASAPNYKDAGFFPVRLGPGIQPIVDLMLIPSSAGYNFAQSTWKALKTARPEFRALFGSGAASDDEAARRYGQAQEKSAGLACLLNLTTAMRQIHLPQKTAFDYLRRVMWDRLAQDRFFAWADPSMIDQIEQAKRQDPPLFENAPGGLHPGATRSYKQIQFGEANVQLTFHENDRLNVDGVDCVMVEPDIDYFRDKAAHLLLEVAVNAFGSLTDPAAVYALRWIAGRRAGVPEFDPLYTIQKA